MLDIIKVGLIGFGSGGQVFHAPVVTSVPGFELVKIRATRQDQVALAKARYPQTEIVGDSDSIINDPNIELVIVATPTNSSHLTLSKQALLAGKHVVVEKPMTITSADADELLSVASAQNRVLSVNHNRRFDGDLATLRKLFDSGLLGDLVEFESHYDRFRNFARPNAWREEDIPGAGILYDLGAHLIDQAQALFGLPEAITADVRNQRKFAKATDNFELILHYPKLKVTLKAGMLVREPLPRFIITGDKGMFVKYGMDVQEDALKAGRIPNDSPQWGVEPESVWGRINAEYKGMKITGSIESEKGDYSGFYKNMYDAIRNNAELIVKPAEARNTVRIIELAIQSNSERRTVNYS